MGSGVMLDVSTHELLLVLIVGSASILRTTMAPVSPSFSHGFQTAHCLLVCLVWQCWSRTAKRGRHRHFVMHLACRRSFPCVVVCCAVAQMPKGTNLIACRAAQSRGRFVSWATPMANMHPASLIGCATVCLEGLE